MTTSLSAEPPRLQFHYGAGTPGVGICPKCGSRSIPPHDPAKSIATALACLNPACGFVVELQEREPSGPSGKS